jgi:hypothetical protein
MAGTLAHQAGARPKGVGFLWAPKKERWRCWPTRPRGGLGQTGHANVNHALRSAAPPSIRAALSPSFKIKTTTLQRMAASLPGSRDRLHVLHLRGYLALATRDDDPSRHGRTQARALACDHPERSAHKLNELTSRRSPKYRIVPQSREPPAGSPEGSKRLTAVDGGNRVAASRGSSSRGQDRSWYEPRKSSSWQRVLSKERKTNNTRVIGCMRGHRRHQKLASLIDESGRNA